MTKAPADLRSFARSHTKMAVNTLVGIAKNRKAPEAARVGAAIHLLDRGWGKAPQAVTVDGEASIKVVIRHILEGTDGEAIDAEPAGLIEDSKVIDGKIEG